MHLEKSIVVKSNDLIQKTRYDLSTKQQKILLFLISKIKTNDNSSKFYEFTINEFCEICDIEKNNGKNINNIKKDILNLEKKRFFMDNENTSISMGWINKTKIHKKNGLIQIRFDDDIFPFLFQLKENFTQYSILNTLSMKSKYSIRLYELFKSYENLNIEVCYSVENFQKLMNSNYTRWIDVKKRVLEPALNEINNLTDIYVDCIYKKQGRAVSKIYFTINKSPLPCNIH